MSAKKKKPTVSLFFPVYNDEATVRRVAEKSLKVLNDVASDHEVIIVNDGSPDDSGEVADRLAREYEKVRVIHHERNKGYGKALQTGFENATLGEWICFTDGDDQYDVNELGHIVKLLSRYDMIITFRYCKIYSTWRMFVSHVYNMVLRAIFRCPYRDISSGLKLIRRDVLDDIDVCSSSPFVGAEVTLKADLKGYRIGEVGISTYPRYFGESTSTSWKNIKATIGDMLRFRREVFTNRPRPELEDSNLDQTKRSNAES